MDLLRRYLGRNGWEVAATLFPLAADLVHWALFEPLNDWIRSLLETQGTRPALLLLGTYLAWLVSLVLVGRLEPEVRLRPLELAVRDRDGRARRLRTSWPKLLFFYPSLLFGAVWLMLLARCAGLTSRAPVMSDGAQQAVLLAAAGLFIGHCVIAAVEVRPRHAAGTPGHLAVLVPVVLVGELTLNLATAAWLVLFAPGPAEQPVRSPGTFALALPLFLLCFAGPRFAFLSRHFTLPALLGGLGFVAWEVWETLAQVAF